MSRFTQIEVFVRTAELGSLSRAAEVLGMSNAAVSRHLKALEERLAVRLIERNTRRSWLTEAGEEFLARGAALLADLAEAEDSVAARALSPRGLLRVTSSLSFATIYLAPMLPALRRRYPKLNVQIIAANRYLDFIESGIDVAIRTRESEPDSGIVVRRIGQMNRVLAASPDYFIARGRPRTPADLQDHDFLVYNLANDPYSLRLERDGTIETIRITAALDSNDGQIIRQAALGGLGILIQPLYIVHADIAAGLLVPILDDWSLPPLTMNIAYQNRTQPPAKIRAFTDHLIEHIRAHAPRDLWRR